MRACFTANCATRYVTTAVPADTAIGSRERKVLHAAAVHTSTNSRVEAEK